MQRVAIIGNAGGGKSTFAQKLGNKLNLPVHHIDLLQWKPGWVSTSVAEFDREHERWLSEPHWIIDGWGRPATLVRRFDIADTLIFIDFPIALHYWWATKRQIQSIVAPQSDWPPPGCNAWEVTGRLYQMMWTIHTTMRSQLLNQISSYRDHKRVEIIRSPRDLADLLESV